MRAALLKHGSQHVAAIYRGLTGRLRLQQGALKNALERGGRLRPGIEALRQLLDAGLEELLQLLFELIGIGAAVADHVKAGLLLEQGIKKMLERQVLVPSLRRFFQRTIDCLL